VDDEEPSLCRRQSGSVRIHRLDGVMTRRAAVFAGRETPRDHGYRREPEEHDLLFTGNPGAGLLERRPFGPVPGVRLIRLRRQ
jgi:hypothetical protein